MSSLLIIDDEPNVCYSLQRALESPTLKISTAGTAREGIQCIRRSTPDAVILDVRLPDMSGLEAYAMIRQIDARLPVIVITAHGTTETAIEAMKLGAFEYLLKPLDLDQLGNVVDRAIHLSRISRMPAMYDEKQEPQAEGDQLVGSSPPMQELYKSIGRIAPQDVTVLILGESGTGQGVGGPGDLSAQPPQPGPVPGDQLRSHPRTAAGKRTVRPRARRVHRRRSAAHRQIRAGPRRHGLHG